MLLMLDEPVDQSAEGVGELVDGLGALDGGIAFVGDFGKHLASGRLGVIERDLRHLAERHAPVLAGHLVLREVGARAAVAEPDAEAAHRIVEFDVINLPGRWLELVDVGLGELHFLISSGCGTTMGRFCASSCVSICHESNEVYAPKPL